MDLQFVHEEEHSSVKSVPTVTISYLVSTGDTVTLKCEVSATSDLTSVQWKRETSRENSILTIDELKYSGSKPSSPSLVIKDVSSKDAGTYMCYATSKEGTGKSAPAILTVSGGCPKLTIKKRRWKEKEGQNVVLKCSVTPDPPVTSVVWYKGEEKIVIDNDKFIGGSVSSPSLTITEIEKETDEGEYVCEAQNADGKGRSDVITLEVQGPDFCADGNPRINLQDNRSVNIYQVEKATNVISGDGAIVLSEDKISQAEIERMETISSETKQFHSNIIDQFESLEKGMKNEASKNNKAVRKMCEGAVQNGVMQIELLNELKDKVKDMDKHLGESIGQVISQIRKLQSEGVPDVQAVNVIFPLDDDLNNIDPELRNDIQRQIVEKMKISEKRVNVTINPEYVMIVLEIQGATTRFEDSAAWVANRIKQAVRSKKLQFSDECNKPIRIKAGSTTIETPQDTTGIPIISISRGKLIVKEGEDVILRCTIISSSEAKFVKWSRLVDGSVSIPIDIDNKKYMGGSLDAPSLVISAVTKQDQGTYFCTAGNVFGTAQSNLPLLEVLENADRKTSSIEETEEDVRNLERNSNKEQRSESNTDTNEQATALLCVGQEPSTDSEEHNSLETFEWFVGNLSWDVVNNLLTYTLPGTFLCLMNKTTKLPCLAVRDVLTCTHLEILQNTQNEFYIRSGRTFQTLPQLIDHYKENPLPDGGSLLCPVKSNRVNVKDPKYLLQVAWCGDLEWFKMCHDRLMEMTNSTSPFSIENVTDYAQRTAMHYACHSGCLELCSFICMKYPGLSSRRDSYGRHCLHYAAMCDNIECFIHIVGLVLDNASIMLELKDENDSSILHTACYNGSTEICRYLCNNFPSLLIMRDQNGNHCLHRAVQSLDFNCYKTVETLLLMGKTKENKHKFMEELTNENGQTVLHWASQCNCMVICRYLCKNYPSLSSKRDCDNNHSLHYIVQGSGNLECYKVVEASISENNPKSDYMALLTTVIELAKKTLRPNHALYKYLKERWES